jgi:hypothetical protein
MNRYLISPVFIFLVLFSCTKTERVTIPKPTDIIGKWKLVGICANDSWGAPAYWRDVKSNASVEFTADGKYYREGGLSDDSLYLSGNFIKQKDSSILVVPFNPLNYNPAHPESSNYTLYYSLETGGFLILRSGAFEGVVAEKYILSN